MKALEWSQHFSHCKSIEIFSDPQGSLLRCQESDLIEIKRAFMVVLVTCKNEEDPIKNEGARVLTSLYVNFSYA